MLEDLGTSMNGPDFETDLTENVKQIKADKNKISSSMSVWKYISNRNTPTTITKTDLATQVPFFREIRCR